MTKIKKWTTINSRFVIDNQWCKVRQDKIQLSNGKIIDDYFVNLRPDIALILPITPNQEIVFVRQYRHGVQEILLELPAGTFNSQKEDSLKAAKRELLEETGYTASKFTQIAMLYDNPVKDSNKIYLFVAEDATYCDQQRLDETEEIEVVIIPITQIKEKINQGEICVCGSVTAILLGLDFLTRIQSIKN
ncbi:NUDIX hydrolase [Stanieria cyanosphaera PCC 7437]|uniref:NUDIX hydrolase n=1 Tax=Stanieria cyanosphaera (strain ATCC 29371 / PCC 7437) TaxID=111780 RepID=K9XSG0_STAC7|nr:NUDIX hydrolase [Stanieria cyanosphaera]AFZ34587.1 NUDIX hydrolase [Stanieria cyanosphaera PCC 7437]